MLESYKESQPEFFSVISSSVGIHHKISHAYLIDTSGFAKAKELVMAFAKFLLCTKHLTNMNHCENCNLCSLIDKNLDNHIQTISSEGNLWIKKEQLQSLKENLSKKSIDQLNQIYIIEEAEKLNAAAANSLLKFLEEPEEGIIAILVTNNRYKLLPTILSRCQVYTLKSEKSNIIDEDYVNLFDFIMNIERNHCHTICYIQDLWHNKYKTKEEILDAFSKMEYMLLDFIHYKINGKTEFLNFIEDIKFIVSINSEEALVRKLSKIIECKNQIQYNANIALLMDKFIIEYVGGDKFD